MADLFDEAGAGVPVIVRAATTNLERPPEWQRKAGYALDERRAAALRRAVAQRIKDWAQEAVVAALLDQPALAGAGDAVACRHERWRPCMRTRWARRA